MRYGNDNFTAWVLFLSILYTTGLFIDFIFDIQGVIIYVSILIIYFLTKLIPNKCIHGKRGKCDKCKEEYEVRQKEIEVRYHNERLEKERQYQIQLDIVSNRNEILNQLTVYNSQSIEKMIKQTPYEFEHSVSKIYEGLGYKVRVTSQSNDKGKDIIMFKDGKKYLVECKKYSSDNLVNRPELQKFMAAIYEEKAVKGYFVTTSDFTSTAAAYPDDVNNKLELINGHELMKMFYTVYPKLTKYLKYNMICEECGDTVEFIYPGHLQSVCKKHHKVVSDIEELIKINASPKKKISTKDKRCPKCNSAMRKIWSKKNSQHFLGCINYPMCNGTLPIRSYP